MPGFAQGRAKGTGFEPSHPPEQKAAVESDLLSHAASPGTSWARGASRGEPNLGARVGRSCLAGDGHQQSSAGLGPNTPWKHFVARGDVKALESSSQPVPCAGTEAPSSDAKSSVVCECL